MITHIVENASILASLDISLSSSSSVITMNIMDFIIMISLVFINQHSMTYYSVTASLCVAVKCVVFTDIKELLCNLLA